MKFLLASVATVLVLASVVSGISLNEVEPQRGSNSSESSSQEDSPNVCEGLLIGILKHPSSCFKYISCYLETATEQTCPPDTIFDLQEITCVPGNQRTCRKEGEEVPLPGDMCRGIILGTMVHPEDCAKYVSCFLGRARERSCRRGFVFSERLMICLPGDLNSCQVTLVPTTTTIAPEDVRPIPLDYCRSNNVSVGLLPHPQFCTRYVACALWIPIERECDRFQVFSERLSMCLPGNVNRCRPIFGLKDAQIEA
uniref:Putative tequila n=1 Tax=Anopheles aquasalis TaxID=42839 RepID=T1DGF4_ANOAQ